MSQWKADGAGEYIPAHELNETTLMTKHTNLPHTPTPTLSLYGDHPYLPTSTSWNFEDQRRQKAYSTNPETTTRTISYQQQLPDNKQWSRQEKVPNKPSMDYTTNNKNISPPTSLLHPLANDYVNLHPDGSSVRTTPSQVIPPVTLPTNHHRIGNQGMVAMVDNKYHQYQQQLQQSQLTTHSGHSLYSENKDTHRPAKYYSRSFSDTPHSLLSYHHHHSSQNRHNSIATAEHAAAVAAAYQSQSLDPGQMAWYGQQSTLQKGSLSTTPPPSYNHSTSSSPRLNKRQNDTDVYQGSNYAQMSDLLATSRIDNVDYGIASSSGHFLGQHRQSHQWTSSSSSSTSSSPTPQSPRTNDMHSLLSIPFTPNESYNKKNNDTSIMDQQSSLATPSSLTPPLHVNDSSEDPKKKAKKLQQQKPQTGKRRSPNAFFVYCSERRQILKQGKPNARNTDINRQLGLDWKALTEAEQNWYKEKANKIRASLPNDNTPTPKSMTSNLFTTSQSNNSPFTYGATSHPSFDDFTHSPNSNRNNSLALTIAADDESVGSFGINSRKRGSLAGSDLSASSAPSPSQHPLAVASLSGAAEANALDQAALVGIHPCQNPEPKVERLKRPPNAYLLFNREMRRKLLDQNENLTVALISKLISQSWRDLPLETKDGYRNEAAKLKKQHLEAHPDYVYIRRSRSELAQAGYRSRPSKKRKKSVDIEKPAKTTNDPEATQDGKQPTRRFPDPRGRKKKKHKNPFGPKHPMSGFLYFASEIRPEIVLKHPKSNVGVISKVMAERWKKMTEQEKQPWEEKARLDKARYAREVLAFKLAQEQTENQKKEDGSLKKKSSISSLPDLMHRNDNHPHYRHHQKQFYEPVSRIHSALTSSRPASPTELDSHTIQTVAQMVNPRGPALARDLHPLSTSSSLASLMHHHESTIGSLQLHVPATPPSPAIDTI